jgi:rubredoxin
MAYPVPRDERRQSYCPNCHTRGIPFRINTALGLLLITYRCEACGYEWTVQSPARDIQLQLSHP